MRILKFFFIVVLVALAMSCRKDTDNPGNSNLLENTGEPSVTAGVEDVSFFIVTLCGYHNLDQGGTFGFFLNTNRDDLEFGIHNESLYFDDYTIQLPGRLYKIKTTVKPGTTYFFRAFCEGGEARYVGEIISFTTPESSLEAFTDEAVVKSPVEVELKGHFSVDGIVPNCACTFMYGTDPDYIDQSFPSFVNEKDNTSLSITATLPQIGVTYYYKVKVKVVVDGGVVESEGEVKSFKVPGPTASNPIDLGGGVQWAAYNVGAGSPEQFGSYFMWGETAERSTWPQSPSPYTEVPSVLPSDKDAATANLGSSWRMPTRDEFEALGDYCVAYKTSFRNKNGILFVSKKNGNSMFLPSAGYYYGTNDSMGKICNYWSASPAKESTSAFASALYVYTNLGNGILPQIVSPPPPFVSDKNRAYGAPVRPVKK